MPQHGNLGQCSLSLCPWALHCGCPELYSMEGSPRISCAARRHVTIKYILYYTILYYTMFSHCLDRGIYDISNLNDQNLIVPNQLYLFFWKIFSCYQISLIEAAKPFKSNRKCFEAKLKPWSDGNEVFRKSHFESFDWSLRSLKEP